jgi:hypothetical protein
MQTFKFYRTMTRNCKYTAKKLKFLWTKNTVSSEIYDDILIQFTASENNIGHFQQANPRLCRMKHLATKLQVMLCNIQDPRTELL